jgi:hypothetical protein
MPPDFSEWKAREAARAPAGPSPAELAVHLRAAHVVAGQMTDLVKGEDWATYRAHLETLRDEDRARATALEAAMAQGDAVGEELTRQKLQARYHRGRLDVWELVLNLPQLLVAQHADLQPPPVVAEPAA